MRAENEWPDRVAFSGRCQSLGNTAAWWAPKSSGRCVLIVTSSPSTPLNSVVGAAGRRHAVPWRCGPILGRSTGRNRSCRGARRTSVAIRRGPHCVPVQSHGRRREFLRLLQLEDQDLRLFVTFVIVYRIGFSDVMTGTFMAACPLLSRLPKRGILRNQGGAPAVLASLGKYDSAVWVRCSPGRKFAANSRASRSPSNVVKTCVGGARGLRA